MSERGKAIKVLSANTFAFTVCFAVWMMNGVLITFLVDNGVYSFTKAQMGWLIGIPVLTGSLFRLPAGMLTDRYGGRPVFAIVMLLAAVAAFLDSYADSFGGFLLGGLGFGLAGSSFAVGIAYSSMWFSSERQGTALGIFGAGNLGAAVTAMGAPWLLGVLTDGGANLDGWRMLPRIYAGLLVATTVLFWFFTHSKKPEEATPRTLVQRLEPLKKARVWRFGLYYFLVFGGFVALAQWLIPYYVNVYTVSVVVAGLLSAIFTLPAGVIRAAGGWMSDRFGARTVMYWVLSGTVLACLALIVPRMDIYSPGEGVMALRAGTVTAVSREAVTVGDKTYVLQPISPEGPRREGTLVWPTTAFGQEPVVKVGDPITKRQLLARGITHIYFQANIWVFTGLLFLVGILMGIGSAAVYKHIPSYYPADVGTVGGIVGVIGGLGGFVSPIIFGYFVRGTGIWTTTWMFLVAVSLACLVWMHLVIRRMEHRRAPDIADRIEDTDNPTTPRAS
ncbi:MAG: MFS transporter [Candidatus Krumholzibacteria bacterium]